MSVSPEHIEAFALNADGTAPPLCDELAAALWTSHKSGMTFIKHPFVNEIYTPGLAGRFNRQLAEKQRLVERARSEQEWSTYVWLHERPWRLQALLDVADRCDDVEWWLLARDVWIDSENVHEHYDEWRSIFTSDHDNRAALMLDDELDVLAAKGERFTIYRGCAEPDFVGLSWTLDRERATWFAQRSARLHGGDHGWLLVGRVRRSNVVAYFTTRSEEEIVVLPEQVSISQRRKVTL